MTTINPPTIPEIEAAKSRLHPLVSETPTWEWRSNLLTSLVGNNTSVYLKLELFQLSGSFKPRGAISVMLSMSTEALKRGVTAVSAGNHAAAVGYAASVLGSSAKVVMPRSASIARVRLCQSYGAEVILADDIKHAFSLAREIESNEGRTFVHPFEGPLTALGTATLGMEFYQQRKDLDIVVVPIGGGGLCAGVACAFKQLNPNCKIIGVEPIGADTMFRSFKSGKPEAIEEVRTIADSLGAPYAAPYSFALCRKYVDELVRLEDDELCAAMYILFRDMKLAVEPAGAASTAALLGPLRGNLAGRKVGLIICGANIDSSKYSEYLIRGERYFADADS